MGKTYRVAAIAGDGIGQEVMPEGVRVVQAAAKQFGLSIEFAHSTGRTATTTSNTAR